MNRKSFYLVVLIALIMLAGCVTSPPGLYMGGGIHPFQIDISPCGRYGTIVRYVGRGTDVLIQQQIGGLTIVGIAEGAFDGSQRVRRAGDRIIRRRVRLTSVTIPPTITYIGEGAFAHNRLISVSIPNSVTHIGEGAFMNNQLSSVSISHGVTYIRTRAFADNRIISVTIPAHVTYIEREAFMNNQLTSVFISPSVERIGQYAFANNLLIRGNVANLGGVTWIRHGAFDGNPRFERYFMQ